MTRSTTREPERRRLLERPRRRRDGEVEGLGFFSSLSASVDFSLEGHWDAMATMETGSDANCQNFEEDEQ